MNKTITISARISQEDAEFISQLKVNDAKTPSDKLRAIVSEARQRHQNKQDFRGALTMCQQMLMPVKSCISETEHIEEIHSELIARTLEWLPDMMALALTISPTDKPLNSEQAIQFEQAMTDRVFRLIESTLRLALTQASPSYTPALIHERVAPVLDLLEAIKHIQNSSHHKEEL